jgi:hypothetical protein
MFVFLPSHVLIFFATRLQKNREGTKDAIQRTLAWKMRARSLLALPQLEIWASVVACDDDNCQDNVSSGFENMDAIK